MRVHILRPFGVREGIDFERVDSDLIQPALQHLGYSGSARAGAFAGNIQSDVLEQLATADVVIADLSFHSANLFFELGVRYALRARHTVLIRGRGTAQTPFHFQHLNRLEYDAADPSASVPELISFLEYTTRTSKVDSPIFMAMPRLTPPSADVLQVVPAAFSEELDRAARDRSTGHVRLLAIEARQMTWREEALRRVGNAQFQLGDMVGAQSSFEAVRESQPDDVDVNVRLATVYQRVGRPKESSVAIERALESPRAP